jgi:hypothetical protein
LGRGALYIIAYLFHIMGVPVTCDIQRTLANCDEQLWQSTEAFPVEI